jgi:Tol biopolymer transport system component
MGADGADIRRLTDGFEPDWSPDGTGLVFAIDRGDNADIYSMDADGTGVTRLTDDPGDDVGPDWSPVP